MTHGVGFLPQFDRIVVLVEGRVTETGSYTELVENNGAFAEFLRNYSNMDNEETDGQSDEYIINIYNLDKNNVIYCTVQ